MSRSQIVGLLIALSACASCAHDNRLPDGVKADKILIVKSAHEMTLLSRSRDLKTYKVALGRGAAGAKTERGDHKTPEGDYVIDSKKNPSRFHLALHISYPNQSDRQKAKSLGVDPGGEIEIHGIQNALGWIGSLHRVIDWTDGCIAVTDGEIDEIWVAVPVGTPVEIRP